MLILESFRACHPDRSIVRAVSCKPSYLAFTFIARPQVFHLGTRIYVRLLGACSKTGRLRPLCQHPGDGKLARTHLVVRQPGRFDLLSRGPATCGSAQSKPLSSLSPTPRSGGYAFLSRGHGSGNGAFYTRGCVVEFPAPRPKLPGFATQPSAARRPTDVDSGTPDATTRPVRECTAGAGRLALAPAPVPPLPGP